MDKRLEELDILIRAVPYYDGMVEEAYKWVSKRRDKLIEIETRRLEQAELIAYHSFGGGVHEKIQDKARGNVERKLDKANKQYFIDKNKIRKAIGERLIDCFPELKIAEESELYDG